VAKHEASEQIDGGDLGFVHTPMLDEGIRLWEYEYVD